ncbi:hypothetical protein MMC20_004677 [Loxospora ochrophaea]|nr:hypothetical protein [Loxospora ochrophaea]
MTSFNAFPPHRLHSSRPIPASQALDLLSTYLEAAANDAALHPNALLTEDGPTSVTAGSNTGLVLHNLKRVEVGLRGENLGADLSFAKFGGEGLPDLQLVNGNGVGPNEQHAVEFEVQGTSMDTGPNGWQDPTEFEREQEITQGEIGRRNRAANRTSMNAGDVPSVVETKTSGDREERKRRKKERRKEEKRKKV